VGGANVKSRNLVPTSPLDGSDRVHPPRYEEENTMKYLLLICPDPSLLSEVNPKVEKDTLAWVEEMNRRGVRLDGHRVRPVEEAVNVRVRGGRVVTTDGPFAESKEQMGGYDVLECRDLDEAIEVASKHPCATFGTVEVREFWDF
jgi:hypothetical protein